MVEFIVNKEKCIGADACGSICSKICPTDAISYGEWNGKKLPVADTEICMKNHGCENNCPVKAITILPPQTNSRDF